MIQCKSAAHSRKSLRGRFPSLCGDDLTREKNEDMLQAAYLFFFMPNRAKGCRKMAWVEQGFKWSITVVDNGKNRSTRTYEMTAADHVTALADSALILARFEAMCAGASVSYSIIQVWANDSLVIPADMGVQVEAKALINLEDSVNPLKTHTITVPAPEDGVFVGASGDPANVVDIADADVIAWCDTFSVDGELTLSDGEVSKDAADGGILNGRRTTRYARRG